MVNEKNYLQDMVNICAEFGIDFKVTIDNENIYQGITYNFGKVKWIKGFNETLNQADVLYILLRLGAEYPEQVKKRYS